mgnify:CR=1 FL=1
MKAPNLKTLKLSLLGSQTLSMEKVSKKGLKVVDIIIISVSLSSYPNLES